MQLCRCLIIAAIYIIWRLFSFCILREWKEIQLCTTGLKPPLINPRWQTFRRQLHVFRRNKVMCECVCPHSTLTILSIIGFKQHEPVAYLSFSHRVMEILDGALRENKVREIFKRKYWIRRVQREYMYLLEILISQQQGESHHQIFMR